MFPIPEIIVQVRVSENHWNLIRSGFPKHEPEQESILKMRELFLREPLPGLHP